MAAMAHLRFAMIWVLILAVSSTALASEADTPADATQTTTLVQLVSYDNYIAQHPESPLAFEARFLAARLAMDVGQPKRAIAYLEGLESGLPVIGDLVLAIKARALRNLGQWAPSQRVWKTLYEEFPDSPLRAEASFSIADSLYAIGDLKGADRQYQSSIKRFSRSDRVENARLNLAMIAEREERWSDASSIYERFYYSQPSDPLTPLAKARLDELMTEKRATPASLKSRLRRIDKLLSMRSIDAVKDELGQIEPMVKSRKERYEVMYRRAQLAYRQGLYDEAILLFRTLSEKQGRSNWYSNQRWLARCYSTKGDVDSAVAVHQDLAARYRGSSNGRRALFMAAWLAYNGAKHEVALKLFGEFISRYSRDTSTSEAHWYLAWNAYRLGDLPAAASGLQKLRKSFPRSSLVQRAYYWEGRIATRMGNAQAAQAAYKQALTRSPSSYYAMMSRQRIRELRELGRPIVKDGKRIALASNNDELTGELLESLEPSASELPLGGGMQPLTEVALPWGGSVFDWTSDVGKRTRQLIKFGYITHAAALVSKLTPIDGFTQTEIIIARSTLQQSLGDYAGAYRRATSSFPSILKGELTPETESYFRLSYPLAHQSEILEMSQAVGLSPMLVLGLIRQESAFAAQARSWASAQGLMQIIPSTGQKIADALSLKDYNYGALRVPALNIRFGTWYLAELVKKFRGNPALAVASYNAGPQAVSRWVDLRGGMATDEFIEEIPFRETRHYVKAVLSNFSLYSELYERKAVSVPMTIGTDYLDNINF